MLRFSRRMRVCSCGDSMSQLITTPLTPWPSRTGKTAQRQTKARAHYRLLPSKQAEVTPENMLASHRKRTNERIRSSEAVLCIQDTTKLNFSTRPACEDLQVVGTNQTKATSRGMPLHATLVTTTDGLPLYFDEFARPIRGKLDACARTRCTLSRRKSEGTLGACGGQSGGGRPVWHARGAG